MKNPLSKPEQKLKKGIAKAKQYTKKQIIIPVAIGLIGIGTLTNPQETKGQTFPVQPKAMTTIDTIWGNLLFATKNAVTGDDAPYVNVEFTPDTMQMVTPDTTFYYQTDYGGIGECNLPVGIDLGTGIRERKNEKSEVNIYPNPANGFNIKLNQNNKLEKIIIYNITGQEVKTMPGNKTNQEFINLTDLTNGIYIIQLQTSKGNKTKKFIKTNKQAYENNITNPRSNHQKESKEIYTAVYKVKWHKEGWYTDSTTIELHEGTNDPQIFYLQEKPPGTWRIESIVRDGDSLIPYGKNGDSIPAPLAGVKAYLWTYSGSLLATDTTDSTGVFVFDSIPQNTDVKLTIGDKDGYYSYGGIHWTTPGGVPNGIDSVRTDSVFNTLLKRQITDDNGNIIPAGDIAAMNLDGTRYDTIYYWFSTNSNGIGFTSLAKSQINNDIQTLQAMEHNVYTYVESPTPKPGNKGIKIMPGSNATNASQEAYPTPLGEFHPTYIINMWLTGGNNQLGTWHEFKRATGYDEVTYYSIMRGDAPGYTEEDRKIAEKFIRGYLNMVYHLNTPIPDNIITSYINLNNIRDDTTNK